MTNTFITPSNSYSHYQTSHIRHDDMEELLWDAFNIHQFDQEDLEFDIGEFNVEVNNGCETHRGVGYEQPSKEVASCTSCLNV